MHIVADALTLGGVPLFWPIRKRFGFPPNAEWRFRTGTWREHVIVWGFMIVVAFAIWQAMIVV
jgi:inner membrane protein